MRTPEQKAKNAAYMRERRKDPVIQAYIRAYRELPANKAREAEQRKIRRSGWTPERRKQEVEKWYRWHLRNTWGLTVEKYNALLEEQGGMCAICGATEVGVRKTRFHIDHDHITGVVRGLLCSACNMGIGQFRDSPELLRHAANYLERNERSQ